MALSFDSLTAAQIAAGVAAGDFTATEVAQASLAAIEAREGGVQAFLQVAPELALEAAARVDADRAAGKPLPPLAGVPLAIKDNMNLVGTRTTCASRMLGDYQSVYTATCVQRMLDAGCLPMGKANMDEFAFGSSTESSAFHRTNNPWDTERVPGGSSGGSAAAVAAGEVALSLGSDTGGSIRQPASLCGVVGFKPTYGAVSRYGVVAFGSSLDQVGPFGRTVEDVALAMNALTGAGHDPYDCTSQDCAVDFTEHLNDSIEGKRVGIIPAFMEAEGLTPRSRPLFSAPPRSCRTRVPSWSKSTCRTWMPLSPPTTSSVRPRRSPTWPASTAFAMATRRRAAPTCPTRARSRAPTALAPRPSAARCSAPTC